MPTTEQVHPGRLRLGLREVVYACLCLVLGYLLRVRDSYSLNPVWRKRSEVSKFANGRFPTEEERPPLPVIADLEGDGVSEVILVANDLRHINILAIPGATDRGTLAHVEVKHKAEMTFKQRGEGHVSRPHTVAIGFTEPYQSMMQIRKQIIIVVTDDWQVTCFSHDLRLLWQESLPLPPVDLSQIEVKAMSVLVSSHTINKKHSGLVVVAGSFRHKGHKPDTLGRLKERDAHKNARNRTVEIPMDEDNETLTHFSTFALSAHDGHLLWQHTPDGFDPSKAEKNKGQHWKLSLHHRSTHRGEAPWHDYGGQFDHFWPHMWADNSDSSINLVRVNKEFNPTSSRSSSADPPDPITPASSSGALLPEHLVGFSYGGQRPHDHHEHVMNPNSLVLRSPEGLQVLSVVTGQPLTSLPLPADRALYMDIDKDGHAERIVWDQGSHYSPCFLDIYRIKPVSEKLEQLPVCQTKRMMWTRSWSLEEDVYKKIPPRAVKSLAVKTGVLRHFLGHHLFEDNSYDIITYGGMGRVSSVGLDGTIHWQTMTESKWGDLSLNMRRSGGRPVPDDVKEEFFLSFSPSRVILPMEVSGPRAAIALVGWDTLSIVGLAEGNLLASHSLPSPPTGPLVWGDFDNDGLTDLVLTTRKGYIGFSLKLQHNYEMTALYTLAVFLLIILFSWLVSQMSQGDSDSDKDDDEEDDTDILGGDDNISDISAGGPLQSRHSGL